LLNLFATTIFTVDIIFLIGYLGNVNFNLRTENMIINEHTVNDLIGGDDERPVQFHFTTRTEWDSDDVSKYVVGFATFEFAIVGDVAMMPAEAGALFGADVISKLTDYAADRAALEA